MMITLRGSSRREITGVGSIALPPLEDDPVVAFPGEATISGEVGSGSETERESDIDEGDCLYL